MNFKELIERAGLAWRILKDTDGNSVAHAKRELEAAGYYDGEDDMNQMMAANLIELLRTFSTQGHSGFSASFCRQLFSSLAAYEPLGPLTGADSEWFDHGALGDSTRWQNKRCSHVFKDKDGTAYDINAVIFEEPNGCRFSGRYSHMPVTFPYKPKSVTAHVAEDATDEDKRQAAIAAWATA